MSKTELEKKYPFIKYLKDIPEIGYTDILPSIMKYCEGGDFYLEEDGKFYVEIWLDSEFIANDILEEDKNLTKMFNVWIDNNDMNGSWVEEREKFIEDRGWEVIGSDNTYNWGGDYFWGSVMEYTQFETDEGEQGIIISFHQGGDVRGNYSMPKIYFGDIDEFWAMQDFGDYKEEWAYLFGYDGDIEAMEDDVRRYVKYEINGEEEKLEDSLESPAQLKFNVDERKVNMDKRGIKEDKNSLGIDKGLATEIYNKMKPTASDFTVEKFDDEVYFVIFDDINFKDDKMNMLPALMVEIYVPDKTYYVVAERDVEMIEEMGKYPKYREYINDFKKFEKVMKELGFKGSIFEWDKNERKKKSIKERIDEYEEVEYTSMKDESVKILIDEDTAILPRPEIEKEIDISAIAFAWRKENKNNITYIDLRNGEYVDEPNSYTVFLYGVTDEAYDMGKNFLEDAVDMDIWGNFLILDYFEEDMGIDAKTKMIEDLGEEEFEARVENQMKRGGDRKSVEKYIITSWIKETYPMKWEEWKRRVYDLNYEFYLEGGERFEDEGSLEEIKETLEKTYAKTVPDFFLEETGLSFDEMVEDDNFSGDGYDYEYEYSDDKWKEYYLSYDAKNKMKAIEKILREDTNERKKKTIKEKVELYEDRKIIKTSGKDNDKELIEKKLNDENKKKHVNKGDKLMEKEKIKKIKEGMRKRREMRKKNEKKSGKISQKDNDKELIKKILDEEAKELNVDKDVAPRRVRRPASKRVSRVARLRKNKRKDVPVGRRAGRKGIVKRRRPVVRKEAKPEVDFVSPEVKAKVDFVMEKLEKSIDRADRFGRSYDLDIAGKNVLDVMDKI